MHVVKFAWRASCNSSGRRRLQGGTKTKEGVEGSPQRTTDHGWEKAKGHCRRYMCAAGGESGDSSSTPGVRGQSRTGRGQQQQQQQDEERGERV
mgnify:CR=1 FL=1